MYCGRIRSGLGIAKLCSIFYLILNFVPKMLLKLSYNAQKMLIILNLVFLIQLINRKYEYENTTE